MFTDKKPVKPVSSAPQMVGKEQGKRKRSGGSKGVRMADKQASRVPSFTSHLGAESPVNPKEGFYNPEDYKSDSSEEEDDDDDEDAEGESFDDKPLDSATESAKAAKLSSDLADTEALEKAKALILAAESKATSPDKKRTKSNKKTKVAKTPGEDQKMMMTMMMCQLSPIKMFMCTTQFHV